MLVITMVLVVVLGAVGTALATYAATAVHATRVVTDHTKRLDTAGNTMRLVLDGLRTGTVTCSAVATMVLPTTNTTTSTATTCTTSSTQNYPGFAVVFTGLGVPAGTDLLVATASRKFSGDVFFTTLPKALAVPIEVVNGNVWYTAATCGGPAPTVKNLVISTAGKGFICTTSTWAQLTAPPTLPPVPTAVGNPLGRTDLITGCRVFFPGRYTASPTITGDTYFVSGNYYFDNVGAITVGDASVIGGVPGASPAAATPSSAPPSKCANPLTNPTIAAATTGTGVTWIFGGNSNIQSIAAGSIELYARPQGSRPISLIALATASSGYAATTLTATGTPIFNLESGLGKIIFHGQIWAPSASGSLGSGSGDSNWQFLGGLVIAKLSIMEDMPNLSRIMGTVSNPGIKMLIQVTVNKTTTIRVVADVRSWTRELAINSWRVCCARGLA
jgi:hypothetical protein